MRYLYTFLFYLALPFVFLRLLWRSRRLPDYRKRWTERLGFTPHQLEKSIWVHSVSVGETIAAVPLIKAIQKNYPHIPIVVTNMTPTGAARVKAAFGESVLQTYVPYDLPDVISRFLQRINPLVCIIMETELWPNLFVGCKKKNIPIIVTNARLSEKSMKGYQLIPPLNRDMFQAINVLAAQSSADAGRFMKLGFPQEKIVITGNLKFDVEVPKELSGKSETLRHQLEADLSRHSGEAAKAKIWIAASTHPTEEEIILDAHKKIREKNPRALLILVPRHPDRFHSVAQLAEQQGFTVARRSRNEQCGAQTDIYLADTMGEMLLMYAVSDVAFVAGSFAAVGGHNMLEAAVLGKPIIMGPQLFNFAEASRLLLAAEGMLVVQNADELAAQVIHLFEDENYRKKTGENALRVVEANRGALKKQLDVIKSLLPIMVEEEKIGY